MLYPKAFKFWEEHTNTPCGSNKTQLLGSVWTVTSALEYLCAGGKKKKSQSVSRSVGSDSLGPHGLQPTRLLHPWILQARILE